MDERKTIDVLVDSLKSYVSIISILVVGVYLVRLAPEVGWIQGWLYRLGGGSAILLGGVTGIWYTIALWMKLAEQSGYQRLGPSGRLAFMAGSLLAGVMLATLILASIASSCGTLAEMP